MHACGTLKGVVFKMLMDLVAWKGLECNKKKLWRNSFLTYHSHIPLDLWSSSWKDNVTGLICLLQIIGMVQIVHLLVLVILILFWLYHQCVLLWWRHEFALTNPLNWLYSGILLHDWLTFLILNFWTVFCLLCLFDRSKHSSYAEG